MRRPRRSMIHLAVACVVTVAAMMFVGSNAIASTRGCSASSQLVTITIPSNGLIASKWLDYSGPPRADVLLPACFKASRRYPLLVMLDGLWQNLSAPLPAGVVSAFDGLDAIVVIPEAGNGWYADWWNNGERGDPAWESYELDLVLPAILARYPILPQRRYHALGGVSMGGLGAAYLGGRLPRFFGSVASLSGFVDLDWNNLNLNSPVATSVIDLGTGVASQPATNDLTNGDVPSSGDVEDGDYNLYPVFGPPSGFYFEGHNPTRLAINLKHTRVFESTGTGVPSSAGLADVEASPGDAEAIAEGSALESGAIYPMNQSYHAALTAAGVDVTYQVHAGGHDIPDFINEIKAMIAWGLFKPVVTEPSSWVNKTVATSGRLWDISYRFTQPPDQVVEFRRSGRTLSISAAGSQATIRTARGCVIHTRTPARIRVPTRNCR